MRILYSHYLTDDDHPAAQMVRAVASALQDRGHDVNVYRSGAPSPGGPPGVSVPGVRENNPAVRGIKRKAWFARAMARSVAMRQFDLEEIRRFRPDVVLARQDAYCTSMPWAASRLRAPLVTYADAPVAYESRRFGRDGRWHPPGLVEAIESWTLARSRAVVTVSRPAARRLATYKARAEVHVVPNGVDPERFAPLTDAQKLQVRAALGLTAPKVAAFVGSFKSFHGTDRLRDMILATSHREDTQWLLIGDGPERPALEAALAGRTRALFLGRRTPQQVASLLAVTDVAVAPHAPFRGDFYFCPLKVLEYAAAGCAVVASDQGDIPELLGRGEAGVIISEPGIDPWVIAVNRLLDDPVRRAELGKVARAWVLSRYTWAKTAERIDDVLQGVLKGAASAAESPPPRNEASPFPTGVIAC